MKQDNSGKDNNETPLEKGNKESLQEDSASTINDNMEEGAAKKEETFEASQEKEEAYDNHSDMKSPGEDYTDTSDTDQTPLAERLGSINILGKRIGFGYIALVVLIIVILIFGLKSRFTGKSLEDYQSQEVAPKSDSMPNEMQPDNASDATAKSTESQIQDMESQKATSSDVQQQLATMPPVTITEERIKEIVKEFILNNPEVIMESLTSLEKKEAATNLEKKETVEKEAAPKEELSKTRGTMPMGKPFIGNQNGTLNIIEFFDYRCIHCSKVYPTLTKLIRDYPDLKITLVSLPFMGQESAISAKYSFAVSSLYPDKFPDFHADLLTAQSLDNPSIAKLMDKYSIDKEKVIQLVNSTKTDDFLKENLQLAKKSEVQGVPSFLINGEFLPGAASYEEFKKRIDAKPSAAATASK
jgi:protein-disulfide isomerase